MTRVMYGKVGRTMAFDPAEWGPGLGGDNEPVNLLLALADRHPEVEWVIGSRHAGRPDIELPSNIIFPELPKLTSRNSYRDKVRTYDEAVRPWEETAEALRPYYEDADGVVLWAGQMGTSNLPLPEVADRTKTTKPHDSFMSYFGPITVCLNAWRDVDPLAREEIWLVPDPRNYLKARDVKWPPLRTVLSQFNWARNQKHERWGDTRSPQECGFAGKWTDPGTWQSPHRYTYDALEIVGIPSTWKPEVDFAERVPFRMLVNETRGYVALNRAGVIREWVLPLLTEEGLLRGKWTPKGAEAAGIGDPKPIDHADVPSFVGGARCTFTSPASGSGWATAKPHEAFRLGTVCFFHPRYDSQGHIIPNLDALEGGVLDDRPELKELTRWLRPRNADELWARVAAVSSSRETYEWLRDAQLAREREFWYEQRALHTIEERLNLG